MKRFLTWLRGQFDQRGVMLYAGLALLGGGLAPIFWPASLMVPGVVLTAVSIFGVRATQDPEAGGRV